MTKYIFVTGGVLSSVGKGVALASIGKMLQARGFSVAAIKIDPYVNVDAGTMNPLMHGEVYVTENGGETDLDLGWYERFLDVNILTDNYITTGQIYDSVIKKERRGDYLGKCVQIVPHITDEIKRRIRYVAKKSRADVLLTEIGGTVGDIEGLPFLEAIRQMRLEEGYKDTLFVHLALVPILDSTGEQKTKPLQHSVNELRRIGIQPDTILVRCSKMIEEEAKNKIALFTSVEKSGVFCSPSLDYIYQLPLVLDKQGMGNYINGRLFIKKRTPSWKKWRKHLKGYLKPKHEVKIALCGKYTKLADSYISINEALKQAGAALETQVKIDWIETENFEEDQSKMSVLRSYNGILVPPGFGVRGTEGKILSIKYAREMNIPFLGICFGFQMALVEFARNVCKLKNANSAENEQNTPHAILDFLPGQRNLKDMGGTMRLGGHEIHLKPGTKAHKIYKTNVIVERHRHRYEVNPKYRNILERKGLVFSGKSMKNTRIEIAEYPKNIFHVGVQFHPEFKSRVGKPDPIYFGFVKACLDKKRKMRA
ncbi:MAG: CTP synthase [Candidatus Bathyarchaeota archaeon]